MQEDAKKFYSAVSKVLTEVKIEKDIKYTNLCYENDIATSTYDDIVNAKTKASFYTIAKIIHALGLNFQEFGALLDKELPDDIFSNFE